MNKDKIKIIIGVAILLIAIVLRLVLYSNNTSDEDKDTSSIDYFVIDNYLVFSKDGNKINYLSFDNKEILTNKFNIYLDGNYNGKYYVRKLPSGLKLLDANNNFIDYNDEYVIGSNNNILVSKLNIESTTSYEYEIANKVLKSENIDVSFDKSSSSFIKYRADFNNDGADEYIYSLSNAFSDSSVSYSFLFTYSNNKYNIIDSDISTNLNGYDLSIIGILDVNEDNQLDIVISKIKFSGNDECHEIYKNNDMKFKRIKGCN